MVRKGRPCPVFFDVEKKTDLRDLARRIEGFCLDAGFSGDYELRAFDAKSRFIGAHRDTVSEARAQAELNRARAPNSFLHADATKNPIDRYWQSPKTFVCDGCGTVAGGCLFFLSWIGPVWTSTLPSGWRRRGDKIACSYRCAQIVNAKDWPKEKLA